MKQFKIKSKFDPAGDQPKAIKELIDGLDRKEKAQTLLGVTGSGKTFTIAHVAQKTQRPMIVMSHNKTLAAQLYAELKELFPENRVEYFVSHFDYYRPEAYMPKTDTYIDKTSAANWDLDAMKLASLNALVTRNDTIVVASVAAIYGAMNPSEYVSMFLPLQVDQKITRKKLIHSLILRSYVRNNNSLDSGHFRARGEAIDIVPKWTKDFYFRIEMFDDVIEKIQKRDILNNNLIRHYQNITIFPASDYTTKHETTMKAIKTISTELEERLRYFKKENKLLEAQRLEDRVRHDLEALAEFGVCPGIENYARHLDLRQEGQKSFTLFDYLPENGIVVIDESHMSIPQIKGMFNADFSRKSTLVNYGFRLPSALDNRPLKFNEFEDLAFPKIYVSATPAEYEIDQANGVVVSQVLRPTGLLDPKIEIRSSVSQVETIHDLLVEQIKNDERTFIMTLTIRMAEELTKYLQKQNFKVAYIHNELKTLERSEVLRKLRKGIYDVVVGINLLREGIDIPEVSLVCILDADKESFLRSTRSLVQMSGRAARNQNGRVIFFGDKMTKSMQETINITNERRLFQKKYNQEHNITPQTIIKRIPDPIQGNGSELQVIMSMIKKKKQKRKQTQKVIDDLRQQMLKASKNTDFERAIQLRDIILELESSMK